MRKAIPDGQMKVGLKIQLLFLVGTKSFKLILIFKGRFGYMADLPLAKIQ